MNINCAQLTLDSLKWFSEKWFSNIGKLKGSGSLQHFYITVGL